MEIPQMVIAAKRPMLRRCLTALPGKGSIFRAGAQILLVALFALGAGNGRAQNSPVQNSPAPNSPAPNPSASNLAATLAPTGTLRAVFLGQNPVQGTTAADGKVTGPAAELTAAIAQQLGVPFVISGVGGTAAVMDAVKSGAADIGFLAYDETRAREVDFSQPYELAQNTFLVLQTSPLRTTADIDQGGLNIGVGEKDAADLFLTRTLKNAKLIRNPGGDLSAAVRQLSSNQIDAYAANRQRLHIFAQANPGVRLLPDNFYGVEQAIVVRKGNADGLKAVNATIESARTSGLIAAAIKRAGLVGVDVAPAPEKK